MAAKKTKAKAKAKAKAKPRASSDGAAAAKAKWNLRLYVAGDAPRSRTALANLKRLCAERLKQDYAIEVIDLTKRPDLAKADQIIAVPTLVRKIPEPMKRIIGDLSNADRALVALEMSELVGE